MLTRRQLDSFVCVRGSHNRGGRWRRWYDEVIAHQEDICTIMTMESGKPLSESKSEFLSGCVLYRAALDPPHLCVLLYPPCVLDLQPQSDLPLCVV